MDAELWCRAGPLFDELITLDPAGREERLQTLDEPLRDLLQRLVIAHESADSPLLDRTLGGFVDRALGEDDCAARIPVDLVGRSFGNWRAGEEIARGGMSVVLRAERADGSYQMRAALKLLPPGRATGADSARMMRELRLLARLEHPAIARLLDGGVSDEGLPYIVMEYVDGVPITHHGAAAGLSVPAIIAQFQQVAEAVAYAHRRLVIHADIKPSNVLVDGEGRARLLDFGISSLVGEASDEGDAQNPARVVLRCSPPYASPEQIRGAAPATAQDVFGLGALLYELLCGQGIRSARDAVSVMLGEATATTIDPPSSRASDRSRSLQLKGDLDAICLRCLAHDPDARYPTASALIDDLQRWSDGEPVAARAGGRLYRTGKWLNRHRWVAALGAAVVLSLFAGLGTTLWQAERARSEAARATQALVVAQQSLDRARAIQTFLLELFRSAEPTRPRDQLPGTDAILSLGAERALDADAAPPAERFGMLHTIAEIYLTQGFVDRSAPLVEEAASLARRDRHERPEDHALALRQQAWLAIRERRLEDAEVLLLEAEAWLTDYPAFLATARQCRADRGLVRFMRFDIPAALAILEPLHAEIVAEEGVEASLRYAVDNTLSAAYQSDNQLVAAARLREALTPIVAKLRGAESLGLAVHLANTAGIRRELGEFELARAELLRAIALHDRIFGEQPIEYRAAARHHLARVHLYRGEFDTALREFARSDAEWAAARGIEVEAYPYAALNRATTLLRGGHWSEAAGSAERARALFGENPSAPHDIQAHADALLAHSRCAGGADDRDGEQAAMLELLAGREATAAEHRAVLHEARAVCQMRLGALQQALLEVDRAIAEVTAPGRILETVQRKMLRAEILDGLARDTEMQAELRGVDAALAAAAMDWSVVPEAQRRLRTRLAGEPSG